MRVFGGVGIASRELRSYAALHAIAIIDPQHWPVAVLAAENARWPDPSEAAPALHDCRRLAWLIRPMQQVLQPQADGSLLIPPIPHNAQVSCALDLHEHWSSRLWDTVDAEGDWFGALCTRVGGSAA
jgi:hypothetical protein